jgi:hypothetical protein
MTPSELYEYITNEVINGKDPVTKKSYPMPRKNPIMNSQVIIRIGGQERSLNACKVENGKLILIG